MAGATAIDALAARDWATAYRMLSERPRAELADGDLVHLATAAYLIGEDDTAVEAWSLAYERHLAAGDPAEAARCAFWTAFGLMLRGQMAGAGGWLGRGESVLPRDRECAAGGYLLIPALLQALDRDDAATAERLAREAGAIATRVGDTDLAAFATLGHGQALLAMGDEAAGVARLDEVMLAVSTGEVGAIVTGVVYCAAILECMQRFDLARAAEWTATLDAWCRAQPDLVPYRGQCLVHQAQLRQAAGDWPGALAAVGDACARLSRPPHPALGLACYQEGELHRLHGDVDTAADAYRRARAQGYEPMPGLALLALQRGDLDGARSSIRRVLAEAGPAYQRPGRLAAAVEIEAATGNAAAATEAAAELVAIAATSSSRVLAAMAEQATGAALLASQRPAEAGPHLRRAASSWQQLDVPYEVGRTAVLVGLGCLAGDDPTSAVLELDHARAIFESLGAAPDLAQVHRLLAQVGGHHALSDRELEVLRLVAAGGTTREIATALTISPHTVRRHLENTFAKLGVHSRAAAIAHAYEHHLL